LDTDAAQVPQVGELILVASVAYVSQKLDDGILRGSGHAASGAKRSAFAKRCENLYALI
jgi:hypothetical protein